MFVAAWTMLACQNSATCSLRSPGVHVTVWDIKKNDCISLRLNVARTHVHSVIGVIRVFQSPIPINNEVCPAHWNTERERGRVKFPNGEINTATVIQTKISISTDTRSVVLFQREIGGESQVEISSIKMRYAWSAFSCN